MEGNVKCIFCIEKYTVLGFLARVLNTQKEFKGKVIDSEKEKDSILFTYLLLG